MERLTKDDFIGYADVCDLCDENKFVQIYYRLKEYENTGLTPSEIEHLVKELSISVKHTSVEIGQTVYVLRKNYKYDRNYNTVIVHSILECKVTKKQIKTVASFTVKSNNDYYGTFRENSIGKTVFFTKEEAENYAKRKKYKIE